MNKYTNKSTKQLSYNNKKNNNINYNNKKICFTNNRNQSMYYYVNNKNNKKSKNFEGNIISSPTTTPPFTPPCYQSHFEGEIYHNHSTFFIYQYNNSPVIKSINQSNFNNLQKKKSENMI